MCFTSLPQHCYRTNYHKDNELIVALRDVDNSHIAVYKDVNYIEHILVEAAEKH